jgi:hypothetical protein
MPLLYHTFDYGMRKRRLDDSPDAKGLAASLNNFLRQSSEIQEELKKLSLQNETTFTHTPNSPCFMASDDEPKDKSEAPVSPRQAQL